MAKTYRYISNTLTGLNTGSQDVTYITQSGVINGTMDIRQDSDNDGAGGQSIRIFGSIYGGIRDNFTSDSGDNYIYVGKTGYVDYMLLSGNGCTVVNTGLISANDGDEGIVLRGALGRQNSNASVVLNSGTISAEDRSAVEISSALGKIKVTNSGVLEVASVDVNALFANGTQGGTIVNTGTINGDVEFSGSSFVFSTAAGIVNGSITAGSGDDSITGSAYADEIYGGTGGDTILGLAGNDYIDGGAGNNVLEGGTGNDIYVLSVAGTSIAEDSGEGRDRVEASIDYTLGSNIENLTLTGSAIIGKGNSLNNILTGNGASNTLDGRGGVDTMVGLAGGDTYKVDNTGDRVVELAAGGTDTVIASISYTLEIGQEIELLQAKSGASALNLTGNEFANTLIGNDAVNKVSGGSGSDILVGGLGNDILTGGAGADFFVFNAAVGSKNVDTITDFKASDDTIRLDQDMFTEAGSVGSLLAGAFYVGAAAHDGTDRIIYNKSTGDLIYDSNGNASGGSVVFAHLKVGLTLTAGDFEIIA